MKIQLKRSDVVNVVDSVPTAEKPLPDQLDFGELAINYNTADPSMFFKKSDGVVIRVAGKGADTVKQTLQEVCAEGNETTTEIVVNENIFRGNRQNNLDNIIEGWSKDNEAAGTLTKEYSVSSDGTTLIGGTGGDAKISLGGGTGAARFAGNITFSPNTSTTPKMTLNAAGGSIEADGSITQASAIFTSLNAGGTATSITLTPPAVVPNSFSWILPSSNPPQVDIDGTMTDVNRTIIVNTNGTLSYGPTNGNVPTLADVCAQGNETTGGIQAANFALRHVADDSSVVYVTQKAPDDLAESYTLRWPTTAGSAGQVLTASGTDGQMNWAAASGSANLQEVLTDGNQSDKTLTIVSDYSADPSARTSVITLDKDGLVTAVNFNSTSDAALKHNINPIENALQMLDSINGVSFNWNFNNAPSLGVLAQDVETVAPELVQTANNKSVNYNGLIGILVEAVKELSAEVKSLKG